MKKTLLIILFTLVLIAGFTVFAYADGSFSELITKIEQAASGSVVSLGYNYTYTPGTDGEYKSIVINKDITLDLGGYTITGSGSDSVIIVVSGGALTLHDSSTAKTGKITQPSDAKVEANGGGVRVNAGTTFNMLGGNIEGIAVDSSSGYLGGGVYSSGSFIMSGGSITGCTSKYGGAVYVSGGTDVSGTGRGVFTMTGSATIFACTAEHSGGGVYVEARESAGKFNMNGGTITACTAGNAGGGVYVEARESAGEFEMNGGKITGCTAGNAGGGVYVYYFDVVPAIFKVSGAPVISGNTGGGGINSNVYLSSGTAITLTDKITGSSPIGVSLKDEPYSVDAVITSQFGTHMPGAKPADYFAYDAGKPDLWVGLNSAGEAFIGIHHHVWEFSGSGTNKLTATCKGAGTCDIVKMDAIVSASDADYDGTVKAAAASFTTTSGSACTCAEFEAGTNTEVVDIMYFSGSTPIAEAPSEAGTYTAVLTVTDKSSGDVYNVLAEYEIKAPAASKPRRKKPAEHAAAPFVNPFADVKDSDWFYAPVMWAAENSITSGTGAEQFSPGGLCTRAQVVTFLMKAAKGEYSGDGAKFDDVAADAYYAEAVSWASSLGIVSGTGSGMYRPDMDITREQFAVMLYNYARTSGDGLTGDWMFLLEFNDAGDVSEWANEAIHWCVMKGIMVGSGSNLHPKNTATRAEIVTMLYKYFAGK